MVDKLTTLWKNIEERRNLVIAEIDNRENIIHGFGLEEIRKNALTTLANEYATIMDEINEIIDPTA